jgi:hypothetical protein
MKTQYIKKNDTGTFYYLDKKMTEYHREDGPAYEDANGTKFWYLNGRLHREDGPAIERADGTKEWYLNGRLHREDGPAYEGADGTKTWYLNGKPHREDGPAIECTDGTKAWYLNGKEVSKAEHTRRTRKVPTINVNGKDFTVEELNALIASVK